MVEAKRGGGLKPSASSLVIAVGCIALFAIHQLYVSSVHPSALYMDSLRLLSHLYAFENGHMSVLDIWGFGSSSHRGLITQSVLYANVKLFSLDVLLANRMTGVVVLVLGLLIAVPYVRENLPKTTQSSVLPRSVICYFAILFVALGYSTAGFELFSLDLGLPLWLKNLIFVCYFAAHARNLRTPTTGRSFLLIATAPIVVLAVGMGWSYAFVGAIVCVHILAAYLLESTARSIKSVLPTLAVMASGTIYVQAGGAGDGVTSSALVHKFASAIWLACHSLGSTFIGSETASKLGIPHWAPGIVGVVMAVAVIALLVQRLWSKTWSGTLLPLYLIAYGGLVAMSVGYARGDLGFEAVMASRYYMDLYLFTVGTLWIWSEYVLERPSRSAVMLLLVVQVLLLAGQGVTQWVEWRTAPYRHVAIAAMNEATADGVVDDDESRLLQSPRPDAQRGVDAMRRWGVGVFRNRVDQGERCDDAAIDRSNGWYKAENGTQWTSRTAVLAVPTCECTVFSSVYLPASFSAREIVITEGDTQVMRIKLTPGSTQQVQFPATSRNSIFKIETSATTQPMRDLGQADVRELAALWSVPTFRCEARPQSVPASDQ